MELFGFIIFDNLLFYFHHLPFKIYKSHACNTCLVLFLFFVFITYILYF